MAERLIDMRGRGALTMALALAFLAGCGEPGSGTIRDHSGVAGRVHLGPQCPVEIVGQPCADKPAGGAIVTVAKRVPGDPHASGDVIARTRTDAGGNYRVSVAPGAYVVTADAGMSCDLIGARVVDDAYAKVDIPCDTGIR